ncbi:MAG: phosphoribosylaminoimidazolecarboxamide formyltransferase, partial [Clostridia bacterium]|nr:phosphoribosylaminoimidazolecarboxamide formyltransferase [Clostridia bacterium]
SFGDFIALSTECDKTTAKIIEREVSDGIIAPSYSKEALEILSAKRKGNYNIIKIDSSYKPEPIERKQVFGITFEQGRNEFKIDENLLKNIVSKNKDLPDDKKKDMIIALITLKYTQSNSVCFAYDGQAIGVGAGQQSRIHCTRLAANKADLWNLRQSDRVLSLKFADGIGRPDKNNIIDLYLSDADYPELLESWRKYFAEKPAPFTREEKDAYLKTVSGITLASDAFFPFSDNIERAAKSGVKYVVEPGGSVRDDLVIEAADKHGMVMAFTGMRLFHH